MITLGRTVCLNLGEASSHEWLVTNGLGGYAAGTLPGVNTRRYHGLLVAALKPPVERTMLVNNCDVEVEMDGVTYFLGANEYQDERIHPAGFIHLDSFKLEAGIPYFYYHVGPAILEKTIWMEYGRSTTYIRYTVLESPYPLTLILRPFVNYRDHHKLTKGRLDWNFAVTTLPIGGGCTVQAQPDAQPFYLLASPRATFTPSGVWYWNFLYRAERERGLDYLEDLYLPGVFRSGLHAGESLTLIATAEQPAQVDRNPAAAFARLTARQEQLLRQAGVRPSAEAGNAADPHTDDDGQAAIAQLVLAADQFLVRRSVESAPTPAPVQAAAARPVVYSRAPNAPPIRNNRPGAAPVAGTPPRPTAPAGDDASSPRTMIAGYPWFTDWGRDTMIALPGLTLATGRLPVADSLLRTFARYVDQGMLPNLFPDAGTPPEYNTVDGTLWYFHAIAAYLQAGGDPALAHDLWPTLESIIDWHIRGTRYGIRRDPTDGLLCAGEPGVQLTWMDAKVGDTVFTPRYGKPVEIQALWYHALCIMARLQTQFDLPATTPANDEIAPLNAPRTTQNYIQLADAVRAGFRAQFWYAEGGYLYDVVDGPDQLADSSLRPNQLFALSLEPDLVDATQAHSVLEVVRAKLLTPVGLRSLAPDDPQFQSVYTGDQPHRDATYHQGMVWTWLIGAYGDACRRWEGMDRAGLLALLAPLQEQLAVDCAGNLNEIFQPLPPYLPKGGFAQAWSVAEVLRLLCSGPPVPAG